MKVNSFEELKCWQKAKILSVEIYSLFKSSKDFSFRDQIQRAAISVMNNIAEGFERQSDKEFKHLIFIAKGSCAEVRSMLYIAKELRYINDSQFASLHSDATEISKMLSGLAKTL